MSEVRFSHRMLLVLSLACFFAGLVYFGQLSSPSSYPPYSSLRSDPLGSRLLFEALRGTGKVQVERNYVPLELWRARSAVVLLLGVSPSAVLSWDNAYLANLERLARAGNRLIVGVRDEDQPAPDHKRSLSAIETRWDIRVTGTPALSFQAGKGWQTLAGTPAAYFLSRPFPPGRVSFIFHARLNDEQLANNPAFAFLIPAVIGDKRQVIFDETHLGIAETGSIAALIRRYRLGGLVAGLLILAACFIWSRSRVFPPSRPESDAGKMIAGADERAVLVNLLGRHISKPDLIALCVAEWNRLRPKNRIVGFMAAATDPVAAYRQIQEDLKRTQRIRT